MTKHISMDHNFDDSEKKISFDCLRTACGSNLTQGGVARQLGKDHSEKRLKESNDVQSSHDVQSNSVITNSSGPAIFA
jgi:hypothetical protein